MGQGSTPTTWSTHGWWRWKKEDSIKEKEDPEGRRLENWEENTIARRTGTCNQIQKKYIQELTSSNWADDNLL